MRIGGQKSKQVSKRQENNSKYTEMEKNLSLFVLTLQHQLHSLHNSISNGYHKGS